MEGSDTCDAGANACADRASSVAFGRRLDRAVLLDRSKHSRRHCSIWRRRLSRPIPRPLGHDWTPPRCPNEDCVAHGGLGNAGSPGGPTKPDGDEGCHADASKGGRSARWYVKKGWNWPLCRSRPHQRFRCTLCRRWFSLSTFRADRYDKKPWHNARVVEEVCSGTGLRETARMLGMARTALQLKARKLSKHCHQVHRNQLKHARLGPEFQMDEAITFEGDRRLRPLALAVLIERASWLMVDAFAGPKPPHGSRTEKTKRRIRAMEEAEGPRVDRHKTSVAKVLRTMVSCLVDRKPRFYFLVTDEEPTYGGIFRRVNRALPDTEARHIQESGSLVPRDVHHPLFPAHHTQALMRDRVGRLRRRSWLHSKCRKYLNLMLGMFICYRNYIRPARNGGQQTPGELAEIPDGCLTLGQLIGWRQDWGVERSMRLTAKAA